MGLRTLDAMAAGGIYDHLVGGFCRYSTDARWLVPHFEKMLTDQAQLARAYLHAWQDGGRSEYLVVATETLDFVLRDLSTPEGALYSSFDADAGGVEGAHATFTVEELREILPAPLVGPAAEWYGITPGGNWEGRSIPVRPVGAPLERPPEVEEARLLLAAARARRVQPARDEKVLTEWNAMTVATLAEVAAATGRDDYGRRAEEIGEFLWASMYVDGRLMRSWQGGRARHLAVAADYAWLAEASFRLSEWTGKAVWRERSVRAVLELLELFWDDESGGFFTTGSDAEALVVRPKEFLDGAVPAANSVAVAALLHASALVDDPRIDEAIERTVRLAGPLLERHPGALADMVAALPLWSGRNEIVVTGDRPDLLAEVRRNWLPAAVTLWGEPDGGPLFEGRPPEPGWPTSARGAHARSPRRTPRSWLPSWSHCSHERALRGSGSGDGRRRRRRSTPTRRRYLGRGRERSGQHLRRRRHRPCPGGPHDPRGGRCGRPAPHTRDADRPDAPSPALGPPEGARPDCGRLHPPPSRVVFHDRGHHRRGSGHTDGHAGPGALARGA